MISQNFKLKRSILPTSLHESSKIFSIRRKSRISSIDALRGLVMVIMALDHVRDYFHHDAFVFDPTDLNQTSVVLFFTRWITHFCAPVFVFLSGISAFLYGNGKTGRNLSWYLFTRGVWLVFAELVIIDFVHTFNPAFRILNLQVIWAIGISMICLAALVRLERGYLLLISVLLIAGHNLLDNMRVPGNGLPAMVWSLLHVPKEFIIGRFLVVVRYPVLPWIGIMGLGYCFGHLYDISVDPAERKKALFFQGMAAIVLFIFLRYFNVYGDAARWSVQKNNVFSLLSMLNVTKYPPSLLYALITLGPAFIFLSLAERPLNRLTEKLAVFGRVPFFYYVIHLFLIHLFALIAAVLSGHHASDMILSNRVNHSGALKGYGFSLPVVYGLWAGLILLLYPFCVWFDNYKRANQSSKKWLTYL